jgi:hypothetical protein
MSTPPFKAKPLRQPGESIRKRVFDRLAIEIPILGVGCTIIGIVIGINIGLQVGGRLGFQISNATSWAIMGVALALIIAGGWYLNRRVNRHIAQAERDALGLQGERIVADDLDELKRDGFRIFHDVPPERHGEGLANFDHIVIGSTGVFVIETKARSKMEGVKNEIVVVADGRALVNGFEFDRCPITQASILRDAMKRMLERQTSLRNIFVRGVVLFPEWRLEDRAYRNAGGAIWTFNPPALKKWLRNGRDPVCLSGSDIALLASRIEDHIWHHVERESQS